MERKYRYILIFDDGWFICTKELEDDMIESAMEGKFQILDADLFVQFSDGEWVPVDEGVYF